MRRSRAGGGPGYRGGTPRGGRPCAVAGPARWRWGPRTGRCSKRSCATGGPSSAWRAGRGCCWPWPAASGPGRWRAGWGSTGPASGGSAGATRRAAWRPSTRGPAPGGPGSFPPLARARIENLACSDPAASGRPLTRWSVRSLQQAAVDAGVVPAIHYTTVAAILRRADLQPHRWRHWKSTVWDAAAVARAARVLWCYERVDWLLGRGEVVVGLDEIPNLQALERAGPTVQPAPGRIERVPFEYVRHGTVHWLAALSVHDGRMWGEELGANDGAHFRPAAARLFEAHGWAKRLHLILDPGPSHTATATAALFAAWRP